jgi:hypothetical protein
MEGFQISLANLKNSNMNRQTANSSPQTSTLNFYYCQNSESNRDYLGNLILFLHSPEGKALSQIDRNRLQCEINALKTTHAWPEWFPPTTIGNFRPLPGSMAKNSPKS